MRRCGRRSSRPGVSATWLFFGPRLCAVRIRELCWHESSHTKRGPRGQIIQSSEEDANACILSRSDRRLCDWLGQQDGPPTHASPRLVYSICVDTWTCLLLRDRTCARPTTTWCASRFYGWRVASAQALRAHRGGDGAPSIACGAVTATQPRPSVAAAEQLHPAAGRVHLQTAILRRARNCPARTAPTSAEGLTVTSSLFPSESSCFPKSLSSSGSDPPGLVSKEMWDQ